MADTTFSVRLGDEQKKKFIELAQNAGINNKELMEKLISVYELNKAENSNRLLSSDIKELQKITQRISDIYINAVEKIGIDKIEDEKKHKQELDKKDKYTEELLEKIQKLKDEIEEFKKKEQEQKKYRLKQNEIEETCKNLKELNKMQQDKIEEYNNRVQQIQIYKEDIDKYKQDIEKYNQDINKLQDINNIYSEERDKLQKQNNLLTEKFEEIKDTYNKEGKNLKEHYEKQMNFIEEKCNFEKDKAVLMLKQEQYEKKIEMETKYKDKIDEITGQKEEAEKRLYDLTVEINREKNKVEDIK